MISTGNTNGRSKGDDRAFTSLPKGGGAIRGIGEKFAANPVTGTGSGRPAALLQWLTCETRDDKGNAVLYEYKPEDGAPLQHDLGWDILFPAQRLKKVSYLPVTNTVQKSQR